MGEPCNIPLPCHYCCRCCSSCHYCSNCHPLCLFIPPTLAPACNCSYHPPHSPALIHVPPSLPHSPALVCICGCSCCAAVVCPPSFSLSQPCCYSCCYSQSHPTTAPNPAPAWWWHCHCCCSTAAPAIVGAAPDVSAVVPGATVAAAHITGFSHPPFVIHCHSSFMSAC